MAEEAEYEQILNTATFWYELGYWTGKAESRTDER